MKLNNQNTKNVHIILLLLIALYTINIFGMSAYILLIPLLFIFPLILTIRFKKKYMYTILILFSFVLSTVVIGTFFKQFTLAMSLNLIIYPIVMFLIGIKLAERDYNYKNTHIVFNIIIFFSLLYMLLSLYKTLHFYGNLNTASTHLDNIGLVDFWNNKEKPATVVVVYLSFSLSILPIFFTRHPCMKKKYNILLKVAMMSSFLISIYLSIQLGSRTSLMISIISLISCQVLLFKFSIKKFFSYIIIITTFLFISILFYINVFNMKSIWSSSRLYERFQSSGLESSRFDAWVETLNGMIKNPFGGRESLTVLNYAHNLWLDVANDVGVIPFMLLITFTLISILSFLKFLLKSSHTNYMKVLFISFYVAFFVSFMTEPILRTQERFYFSLFCLVLGLVQGLNSSKNDQKKLENE